MPWRKYWQPTWVFLHGKFHGQKSLKSYSQWGGKESDTTEGLTHTHTSTWSVQFSHSVGSDSFQPYGLQHTRHHCPLPTRRACSTHVHRVSDAIQSSHPLSSPLLLSLSNLSQHHGLFPSVLYIRWPKYWSFSFRISPSNKYIGLISFKMTGWISLLSKGFSRVFSNTTVQKHQFSGAQLSSQSNYHSHTLLQEKP